MPETPTLSPPLASGSHRLVDRPTAMVLLVCAIHLIVWGAMSARWAPMSPDDSLEQVLLSQEWRVEYGKHPPLPTWMLYAVARLFGPSIGATFVLGALCAVATMLVLYVYARPLIGAPRAAVAAMLASNVVYMNAGTANFNHNTLQLPLAILAIALFHRALTRRRAGDWALFGLGCGLMMLAKFSAVILFASFGVYLAWTRRFGEAAIWRGLAIALVCCAAVVTPYELSILTDRVAPDAYAKDAIFPDDVSRFERLKSVYGFASSQLAKVAPALIVFFIIRRGAPKASPRTDSDPVALGPFLTIVGFGPLVLTVIVAALSGARLLVNWGTSFHVLLTLWLVAAMPFAIEAPPAVVRRTAIIGVAMQLILWTVLTLQGGRLPNLNPTPHRVPLPMAEALPETIKRLWAEHCTTPLRYVLTDVNTGASLALRYRGEPRVVDGTRPERARFFSDQARASVGGMVVLPRPAVVAASGAAPLPLDDLYRSATSPSKIELPLSDGRQRDYYFGVLVPTAPGTDNGCKR
jgi:4-amino-4-deoxy-L-arabinose transferase-like glycosyltransferase